MQNPTVPPAEHIRFRARLFTRWSDEDNQNVLNNAIYLTLLEEARWRYFGELGLLSGHSFPFLLAQTQLRFLRPGRGGVEVEVECATVRLGKTSIQQAYRVSPTDGGEPWCEAEALLVTVDASSNLPAPMATELRAAVTEFEDLSQ